MLDIKPQYIVSDDNEPVGVILDIQTFQVNYLWAKDPEASCFIPRTIVRESTGPSPRPEGANILYSN